MARLLLLFALLPPITPLTNQIIPGLRETITTEGVWRIRLAPKSQFIEVFKVEEVGHGKIITDEFMNWRIKLSLRGNGASVTSDGDGAVITSTSISDNFQGNAETRTEGGPIPTA